MRVISRLLPNHRVEDRVEARRFVKSPVCAFVFFLFIPFEIYSIILSNDFKLINSLHRDILMNKFYFQFQASVIALTVLFSSTLSVSAVETNPAKDPLERLSQGNQRYMTSTTVCHDDWTAKRSAVIANQKPFAIIVTCSDSRVPPELIFDQSLGDLFVVRVAGNVVDDFAVGSIEYGVNVLGANLILVLGHSNCGAVDAALKGMKFDNHIQEVLNAIQPAVAATKGQPGNLLEKTTKANVEIVREKLKSSKPVLAKLMENGSLRILGGYYHLDSGKVEFLNKQ